MRAWETNVGADAGSILAIDILRLDPSSFYFGLERAITPPTMATTDPPPNGHHQTNKTQIFMHSTFFPFSSFLFSYDVTTKNLYFAFPFRFLSASDTSQPPALAAIRLVVTFPSSIFFGLFVPDGVTLSLPLSDLKKNPGGKNQFVRPASLAQPGVCCCGCFQLEYRTALFSFGGKCLGMGEKLYTSTMDG
jgi:hypothetical protein